MSALERLEASNRATLDRLRSGEVDAQQLLVQLLTTSCLLEVSKLLSARVDVGTFAPAALEVLTQFAPVDSCAIRIEAPDIPATRAVVGDFSDQTDAALFASVLAGELAEQASLSVGTLIAGANPVGYLAAENLAEAIVSSELIVKVAQQISAGLDALLEAERSRRKLAAARAAELVAQLDDTYTADDLTELVHALAALPSATGARLSLTNPRLGGPVAVQSGQPTDGPQTQCTHEVARRVVLTVDVTWAIEPQPNEEETLRHVVEGLATALGRIERTLRLADEVETDELTGVGNRRRALRMLSSARAWAEREDRSFSVLMLDLDQFKKVNDQLGHGVGDAVLRAFAEMVQTSIREYDTVARWGGEEFLVVCPDTDTQQAMALAARLLAAVPDATAPALPEGWRQTTSIGIATYPVHGDNPTAVVNAADTALYRSKHEGRDRASVAELPTGTKAATVRSR